MYRTRSLSTTPERTLTLAVIAAVPTTYLVGREALRLALVLGDALGWVSAA